MSGTAVLDKPNLLVPGGEVVSEFRRVMDEWNFRPWREGKVPPVTSQDGIHKLMTSAYNRSC